MVKIRKKAPSAAEREAQQLKDYLGLIAPSVVNFRVNREYFILGNTYRSVWAVRGYPTRVQGNGGGAALLSGIGEEDGVTLKIYTNKLSDYEQNQILEKATHHNKQKRFSHKVTTSTAADQNIQDIQNLIIRSHQKKEPFLYCIVFIEIIADSLESLKAKQSTLRGMLSQRKILVDRLFMRQKQGFFSVMPNGKNAFGTQFERALPASSVANLFPFSYSGKTDPNGFYLGRDKNGSNIIVDFDYRAQDKTNGHILVLGNSGEGKSYLMKLILINMLMAGKKIFILDPDDEFKDVARKLGGTYLDMTAGKYCINPLEPRLVAQTQNRDKEIDKDDTGLPMPESFKKGTILTQHIAYLRDFFRVYKNFPEEALDVIEIMLEETYKRAHINDNTDFSQLRPEQFPILSDLYKVIDDRVGTYDADCAHSELIGHPIMYTKALLKSVGLGLHSICLGTDSRYFNNCTNIPNANFIDFSVKGLLNTSENLKNAMFLNIFSFMSNKFLTVGNCMLVVDELHEFVKNKLAIRYINSFMKRGRKYNSIVMIGSQNPEDLLKSDVVNYTAPLLSLPTHSFLFHPGANCNPKEYQSALNVRPYEFGLISTPKQGHCLYKCGNERYHLHVIAPPHKRAIIGDSGGKGAAA